MDSFKRSRGSCTCGAGTGFCWAFAGEPKRMRPMAAAALRKRDRRSPGVGVLMLNLLGPWRSGFACDGFVKADCVPCTTGQLYSPAGQMKHKIRSTSDISDVDGQWAMVVAPLDHCPST